MPRPRPPHLQREITRHGKAVWYVRVGHGPRVRIRAEYGTPEFDEEYRAALAGAPARKAAPSCSSLEWLLTRYRETTAWTDLSAATRRRRDNIFAGVIETAGQEAYARITQATILAGKERRAKAPHQARHFLDAMRGLFRWAHKAGLVKADPTVGVDNPPRKKVKASFRGPRNTSQPTRRAGQLERGKGYGWTCCFTLGSDVVTPCALDANMFAMASQRSRRKRAASRSRSLCRSCRCCKRP
jgi:hypothetical protein